MCYMVTYQETGDTSRSTIPYETLEQARQCAQDAAMKGRENVQVWLLTHSVEVKPQAIWLLTHSVEVKPQAIWKEHAKGLSGL